MTSNLSAKITMDVADLQAKSAVARAELSSLTAEMNKLARSAATGGMTTELNAQLTQTAQRVVNARAKFDELNSSLGKADAHVHGIREIAASIRDLSTGNIGGLSRSIAMVGAEIEHLGFAGVAALAGVTALAGGLALLAVRAIESAHALDEIHIGAEFAGNLDLSRAKIKAFVDQMSAAANVSTSDAEKIAGGFARLKDMSAPEMQALSSLVADFAQASGQEATKAGEELAKAFNDPLKSAKEFVDTLPGATQAQKDQAEAAVRSGNANAAAAAMIDALDASLKRARPDIDAYNGSITASFKNLALFAGMVNGGLDAETAQNVLLAQQNEQRKTQVGLLEQARAALEKMKPTPEQTLQLGVSVAGGENTTAAQIEAAKSKIAEMNSALDVAKQNGDQVNIDRLTAGLEKANHELSALQFDPVVEKMRTDMANLAATWDGTQSGLLAKQRQVAEQALAQTQKGSTENLQVQQEIARLTAQIHTTSGSELIAQTRDQASAIAAETDKGKVQQLEAEVQLWQQLLAGGKLNAQQRIEVEKQYNDSVAALHREQSSENQAIWRNDSDTNIAISKSTIEAKKANLDLELQANTISAAQKLAILRDLTNQEYALDLQGLQERLDAAKTEPVQREEIYNQIRALRAKLNQDLATLDLQAAADAKKQAQEQVTAWKTAIGEITGAESSFLSDYLTGRKTLSQSVIAIADDMALKEIQADARYYTQKLLYSMLGIQADEKQAQGGLIATIIANVGKTTSTATGQAAQTAAVAAGTASRTGIEAAAATTSKATAAATGSATVMQDAAKAFSGTYASVAQIPYVGWILAPAAAAAAFAAVAAYETLASSAGGEWDVPQDRLNLVHKNETIMPASIAGPMRDFFSKGAHQGDFGGATSGISFAGDAHFHMQGPSTFSQRDVERFARSAIRNGNPILRGAIR